MLLFILHLLLSFRFGHFWYQHFFLLYTEQQSTDYRISLLKKNIAFSFLLLLLRVIYRGKL
jgi:hypothetical protein